MSLDVKKFKCTPVLYKKVTENLKKYFKKNNLESKIIEIGELGINFQIKVNKYFLNIYLEPNGIDSDLNKKVELTGFQICYNLSSKNISYEKVKDNSFLYPMLKEKIPMEILELGKNIYKDFLKILNENGLKDL